MNTYTKTAPYDITAALGVGVGFVSELQKEVDTILAKAPALFFENKLALLDEECFDADEALRSDYKERRLEVLRYDSLEKQVKGGHAEQLQEKTFFAPHPNIFSSQKRTDSSVAILWENTRARSYKTDSFKKITVSFEEMCLTFLRKIAIGLTHAMKGVIRITKKIFFRVIEEYTESKEGSNKPTLEDETMKYNHKKRFEFAVSTAVTFALFVFLLVRADFFPEAPRAVLEGQVAGPAFAVDANTALSFPASVSENERSVSATTSVPTLEREVQAENTTVATPVAQPTSAPTQNRTLSATLPQSRTIPTTETVHLTGVLPDRIIIDAIGLNVPVGIPSTADIATIDTVLLKGAALYPPSGTLDQERNLLIMGHSSHLPVVRNQAYKAFNDIEKLTEGNVIKVLSGSKSYVYRVTSVARVPAAEAMVQFNTGKRELTLVTCDNFGDKSDRYIVRAAFVGNY